MLQFFENTDGQELLELVTTHNGFTGESNEKLFYLRNTEADKYYENIKISVVFPINEMPENAFYTTTGWSIKLKYGSEQPSEEEWAEINVNEILNIPNIGTKMEADTTSYKPVWVRVYCPGYTDPTIRTDISLSVSYKELVIS